MINGILRMFDGRLGRIYFAILVILLLVVERIVFAVTAVVVGGIPALGGMILYLLQIAFMILVSGLYVRRLHDAGLSGNWVLISFIPMFFPPLREFGLLITFGMPIVLLLLPPSRGANAFGYPPQHRSLLRAFLNT